MTSITKSLLIGPVLGVIAFLVIGFLHGQTLWIPSTPRDLAILVVIIAATCATGILSNGGTVTEATASSDEETGTVKWFNVKKGYGFITRDQGDDVFVHYRNIVSNGGNGRRAISEGQRVRFIVVTGDKGLQADEVETI